MSATTAIESEEKPAPATLDPVRRVGRPKGEGRITTRYVIAATPEHRAWMESFLPHVGEIEVSDLVRESIRRFAEATGFRPPPKR
jgi:hypothetical protein